jgi:acyl dehydratase
MITVDVRTLRDRVGQEIAVGEWTTISQAQIDQFAEATGDRQWIHLDAERAARESPFKTTIAHGFLTLSLIPMLVVQVSRVNGIRMGVNYGLNKVRFPAPVPVGSKLRAGVKVLSFGEIPGGAQAVNEVTIEREGGDKPCCVAETVVRYYV